MVAYLGGAWLISASESWGKVVATGPFNVSWVKLNVQNAMFSSVKRFEENTGKKAMVRIGQYLQSEYLASAVDPDYDLFIE